MGDHCSAKQRGGLFWRIRENVYPDLARAYLGCDAVGWKRRGGSVILRLLVGEIERDPLEIEEHVSVYSSHSASVERASIQTSGGGYRRMG